MTIRDLLDWIRYSAELDFVRALPFRDGTTTNAYGIFLHDLWVADQDLTRYDDICNGRYMGPRTVVGTLPYFRSNGFPETALHGIDGRVAVAA